MFFERSKLVERHRVAESTFRIRIRSESIAATYLPGQFVMVRVAGRSDPLLGRAFAIYDRWQETDAWAGIDLVFVVKGKMTRELETLVPGSEVEVWGPLGNAFSTEPVDHLILVAGGVGETPMLSVCKEALGASLHSNRPCGYAKRVILCYGARTASFLACVDDFEKAGMEVRISTDDGTAGKKQRVTVTLEEVLRECPGTKRIACCGPEVMMEVTSKIAARENIPCEVSLETPMACGMGICYSCVARITESDGRWDYRRTCVDGPIFDSRRVLWNA